MFLLTAVLFNRNGDCRFGDRVNEMLHKLVPKKVLDEVYVKEPVSAQPEELPQEEVVSEEPYEKQGEQVITADDIVIEDLE